MSTVGMGFTIHLPFAVPAGVSAGATVVVAEVVVVVVAVVVVVVVVMVVVVVVVEIAEETGAVAAPAAAAAAASYVGGGESFFDMCLAAVVPPTPLPVFSPGTFAFAKFHRATGAGREEVAFGPVTMTTRRPEPGVIDQCW